LPHISVCIQVSLVPCNATGIKAKTACDKSRTEEYAILNPVLFCHSYQGFQDNQISVAKVTDM
jgi:hypothetical protein